MPIIRDEGKGAPPPKEAHLAVIFDRAGRMLPLPPGTQLFLVEDPSRPDKIFPMVIKKISHKALVFELEGTEYKYVLQSAKPKTQEAYARIVKNRGGRNGVVKA